MSKNQPPSSRSCALAQAALSKLKLQDQQEKEAAAASGAALASLRLWRDLRGGAIRLIDLERRARFQRVAS